jgi:hypothetical protein
VAVKWREGVDLLQVVDHVVSGSRKKGERGRVKCRCGWTSGRPPGVAVLGLAMRHYASVKSQAAAKGWRVTAGPRGMGISVAERHPVDGVSEPENVAGPL